MGTLRMGGGGLSGVLQCPVPLQWAHYGWGVGGVGECSVACALEKSSATSISEAMLMSVAHAAPGGGIWVHGLLQDPAAGVGEGGWCFYQRP